MDSDHFSQFRDGSVEPSGRRSIFQEIQLRIRSYIFEQGLTPGEMLPPAAEMASYLNVSAASLREGLRALEALGILETKHGVGTFVCAYNLMPIFENLSFNLLFDKEGLYKLIQIREAVEVGLIHTSLPQLSTDEVEYLAQLVQRTSTPRWDRALDIDFHRMLYQCLQNELVTQFLEIYWMVNDKLIDRSAFTPADDLHIWQDHARIVEAVQAKDVDAAVESLRTHFDHAKERLRAGV